MAVKLEHHCLSSEMATTVGGWAWQLSWAAGPGQVSLGGGQGVVDVEVDCSLDWRHWALTLLDLTVLYPWAQSSVFSASTVWPTPKMDFRETRHLEAVPSGILESGRVCVGGRRSLTGGFPTRALSVGSAGPFEGQRAASPPPREALRQ